MSDIKSPQAPQAPSFPQQEPYQQSTQPVEQSQTTPQPAQTTQTTQTTQQQYVQAPSPPSAHAHDVLLYIIALFIPPIAVYFKRQCNADLWINIALWILGWIPGVFHAWWIISKY